MEEKIDKIVYACRWSKNRANSWSGTSLSLLTALKKLVKVEEMDMTLSDLEKLVIKISNAEIRNGKIDFHKPGFCNPFMASFLKRNFTRKEKKYNRDAVILQVGCFGKANVPYYTYQDLAVEALVEMKIKDDPALEYSTYQHIALKDLQRRANEQMEVYQSASGIFTMGKWLAEYLIQTGKLSEEKVHAVGGGTNIDASKVDDSQRKGNKFLFVGRDFKRKGGDLVCKAFDILQKNDFSEAELYVAGPKSKPVECDQNDHIHYIGDLSYEKLSTYYNLCDVFCMPSRYEAYGLVFVEALIYGLPVIARNAFEMSYFVQEGKNGYLLKHDDPQELARIMYETICNLKMKEFVRESREAYIKEYSWDTVAERILKVMEEDKQKDEFNKEKLYI